MDLKSNPPKAVQADVSVKEVVGKDLVRVNFLVPASVRKQWKIVALAEDKTLTELIVEAMELRMSKMSE